MDVAAWLQSLGLSQYEAAFREAEIDDETLPDLTDADLASLGIPLGHRKRLLKAIPRREMASDAALSAQRRQLTVMFCDLVGSTALSSRLDPEDLAEIINAYLRCCAEEIERTGGFVAKYMGDGVLAYFGYPRAHEHDAERAVQAALMIARAVPALPTRHGEPIEVRIGVATGLVVVGELIGVGAAQERAVVGDTPNLAARLQGLAGPNQVVVSRTTYRLTSRRFEWRDLGPVAIKGLAEPEQAWQVLAVRPDDDEFLSRREQGLPALVGREHELARLIDLWRACVTEGGRLVGVVGDPGIGKSRIVHELRRRLANEPHVWLEGGGAQLFSNTPFHAVVQMIRRYLSAAGPAFDPSPLERLEGSLRAAGLDVQESVSLIAELIGLATPDRLTPVTLGAEERRARLLSTLADWIVAIAAGAPTVMFVEDLHWIDPSTLELLTRLAEAGPNVPLLMIYSTRRPELAPWHRGERHVQIRLDGLDADAIRRLVIATARADDPQRPANDALPSRLLEAVVSRAGGVPLFAEELALWIVERGDGAGQREIPSTLSDLLMARLDQLGPAKAIAQVAAVVGNEFGFDLLKAVARGEEDGVRAALEQLTAAEVLTVSGSRSDPVYAFKHALVRDAAYEALLRSQRRDMHRRTAGAITRRFRDIAEAQPEILAQHWMGAEDYEAALASWTRAGAVASRRRAFKEAEAAYRQAADIIATLPESPARDRRELGLQSAFASVLQITRGYSASETAAATARARVLAEKGGDLSAQLRHATTEWAALSSAGDYGEASVLAEQILKLAGALGSASRIAHAHMVQMTSRYRVGDLLGAEEVFTAGRTLFEEPAFRRSPGAMAQTFGNAAHIAWMLGNEAEARARTDYALAVSADNANPYDAAFAHHMAAAIAQLWGEPRRAEALAQQSIDLSDQHGFPQFTAISRIVLGRARAELGDPEDGRALIADGLQGMAATRSRVAMTMYLAWLAETWMFGGDAEKALGALAEALSVNEQEAYFRPEIHRLRGEVLVGMGRVAAAEADYRQALSLAKAMGAGLFHRRALASHAARYTGRPMAG
jgi:class 3 adenylate cyclase/tetratricopeptide (TPR) repeat protein